MIDRSIINDFSYDRVYRKLLRQAVDYADNNRTPNEFIEDFFNLHGIKFKGDYPDVSWPFAIDMCISYITGERDDETYH